MWRRKRGIVRGAFRGQGRSSDHRLPMKLGLDRRRLRLEPLEDRRMLTAYMVNSLADTMLDDGLLTLREALEAADTNVELWDGAIPAGSDTTPDVITFESDLFIDGSEPSPGTIIFAAGNDQLEITDAVGVVIQGPGAELLTIDANNLSRVFFVESGAVATLSGMTITGGYSIDNKPEDGISEGGSGLLNRGNATITQVSVLNNVTYDYGRGGGVCNDQGTLTINASLISSNESVYSDGGGIFNNRGTVIISDSTISHNKSFYYGGGIDSHSGTLTITRSDILHNSSSDRTGGISNSGYLTISDSLIASNSGRSGGISNRGTLNIVNTIVCGNSATTGTGGIATSSVSNITCTTIVANSSQTGNGGLSGSDTLTLTNSIVTFNTSPSGSDISGYFDPGSGFNLLSVDPRFVSNPSDGGDGWGDDPTTPAIDEGANDDYGDLHLLSNSTAIDMGNGATLPPGLTTDLDGSARIVGSSVDIGAYEYQDVTPPGREDPSAVVTTENDSFDLYDGLISLREALYYVGRGGLGNTVTFNAALDGGRIVLGGQSLFLDGEIRIDGSSLSSITIDADAKSRVFTGATELDAEFLCLTITGGYADDGGGIQASGMLLLNQVTLSGNVAVDDGGGILGSGTLVLDQTTVTDNVAGDEGGGIRFSGSMTIRDSDISSNSVIDSSGYGGGGIFSYGTSTITGTTISYNTSDCHGGGIYIYDKGHATIMDSIISNNRASGGGAINCNFHSGATTLDVIRTTITDNHASSDGGAIRSVYHVTTTVEDSTISNNTAGGSGGGIYSYYSTTNVIDSTISGNEAAGTYDYGGGIYGYHDTISVVGSTLSDNVVYNRGGAIGIESCTMSVVDSIIRGNIASSNMGGGVCVNSGTVTVSGSLFLGNSATWGGGYGNRYGTSTITNSVFVGNSAQYGGAIHHDDNDLMLTLINCSISGNAASDRGGGILGDWLENGVMVHNSIVALNDAPSGPDVYDAPEPGSSNNLIGVDPCFVRNPDDGGDGWGDDPSTPEVDESLNDDYGDLHLLTNSPAVNAGSNALAIDSDGYPLETDIVGKQRIVYDTVDIGAYEFCLPGDADYSGVVSAGDYAILADNWGAQYPKTPGDVNRDGIVDENDMVILSAHWGLASGAYWSNGDFNNDGIVDAVDASILAANWGRTSNHVVWDDGDFNDDGIVNAADASILAANWGATCLSLGEKDPTEPGVIDYRPLIGPLMANMSFTPRRLLQSVRRVESAASALIREIAIGDSTRQTAAASDEVLAREYDSQQKAVAETFLERQFLAWSHIMAQQTGHAQQKEGDQLIPSATAADWLLATEKP